MTSCRLSLRKSGDEGPMSISPRLKAPIFTVIVIGLFFEVGERLSIPGMRGFVSTAEAIVGRPLTPLSVAGVARRTARRCAAGIYVC
jgi:hypothetical protein